MIRTAASAAVLLALAGCASFSKDGGFERVNALTRERTGQSAAWQRTDADHAMAGGRVSELLAHSLTADSAVEIALLNNRSLQASFAELGVAEADLVSAGRLPNPTFSFGHTNGNGIVEIDRAIVFNIVGLLTMPLGLQVERQRFETAQYQAAYQAVGVAADTRRGFFGAVAAQDLVKYYRQVKEAADASNELARRMVQAGNFNQLAQMRQQAFYSDATSQLARAQHQALAERERLTRLLGLAPDQLNFTLPERLPDLPKEPAESGDAEQIAIDKRLDVWMAKRATESVAMSLGLTNVTRFVNVLDAGYANKSQTGEGSRNGYQIELQLPLFDFGSARIARAEATYLQAVNRTAAIATDARSEVRESYSAYRTSYDLAKHYRDEVVPLRKRISETNLLRYNGMLISVFELLADSRDQVMSVTAYVEALRDYWIAETNLQTAMTSRSPGAAAAMSPSIGGAAAMSSSPQP